MCKWTHAVQTHVVQVNCIFLSLAIGGSLLCRRKKDFEFQIKKTLLLVLVLMGTKFCL